MSWTTPRTWVTGEIVTSAIMNAHVRDNLAALHDTLENDPGTTGVIHGHLSGALASRPAAGNAGRLFAATDTLELYVDFGTSGWIKQLAIPDLKNHWLYVVTGGPIA